MPFVYLHCGSICGIWDWQSTIVEDLNDSQDPKHTLFCRESAFVAIYALFSDNKCPLFARLGGGSPKGDNVTFLPFFYIRASLIHFLNLFFLFFEERWLASVVRVGALPHCRLVLKNPNLSLVEVEDKEGHREDGGLADEDQGEGQDEVVVGGQDDRDYRLVIILYILLPQCNGSLQRCLS